MRQNGERGPLLDRDRLRRYFAVMAPACIGLALSFATFFVVRGWEDQKILESFKFDSSNRVAALERAVESDRWLIKAVAGLYNVSTSVERWQFRDFVKDFISCHPGVQAIEWIPRVADSERDEYEEAARMEGWSDFQITDRLAQGQMVRGARRDEYFPVYFVEPYKGNEVAMGFDLASNPTRLEALELARDRGEMAATERITLVQETAHQNGFLIYLPIYRNGPRTDSVEWRRNNLQGFVLGVFRIGGILEAALSNLHPDGIDILLEDRSAPENDRLLYFHPSRLLKEKTGVEPKLGSSGDFEYSKSIMVANRTWQVTCTPIPQYISEKRGWQSWGLLLAGLFATGVITVFVAGVMGRAARIERLVEQRTAELSEAKRAVETAYLQVEERIAQRTAELDQSNRQLQLEVAERLNSEAALEQSEREKRVILDSIEERLTYHDLDMKILWANRVAGESRRLSPAELVGRHCHEVCQSRSEPCMDCPVVKSIETRKPAVGEMTDPEGRVWLIRGYPVYDGNGSVVGVVDVASDVSEAKRTARLLRESEEKHRLLIENMPAIVYTGFMDWSVEFVDDKIEQLTGYGINEFNSHERRWSDLICLEDLRSVKKEFIHALKAGRPFVQEYRIRTRNGDIRWIQDRGRVIGNNGEVRSITGFLFDITDHKQVESALQESEELLKSILTASPVGIGLARNGVLDWANPTMYGIVGYEDGSLLGKDGSILYMDREEYKRAGRELNAGILEEGVGESHARWIRKDGKVIRCHIHASPLDSADPSRGIIYAVADITEREALEEQIRHLQKMEAIGTMAGGIAHDFNNILGIILGYAEMATFDTQKGAPVWDKLQQVISASIRAKELVKQILAFSRQSEDQRRPVLVAPLAKEALKLLRSTLPSTIEIRQSIGAPSSSVVADPVQIHQILMNLCTNASHAMRGQIGTLDVSLDDAELGLESATPHPDLHQGHYLKLTVRDTGHGMDDATKLRIFEPYFTTKKPGEGTGLGLAVVHGIVKGMGGAIMVDSAVGKGTTFRVFFPRIANAASSGIEAAEALPTGSERILFVDDEKELVEIGKKMLEHLGYRVTARTSPIEALEAFRAKPGEFDLVITDMTMPNMTGVELSREMLRLQDGITIILCTGFSELITAEDARTMGIRELQMKPLVLSDMARTVRRALGGESVNR